MTSSSQNLSVSVIIPTYNGKHRIGNLLRALEEQTVKPVEVIVVVDGSTDGTEDFLHKEKCNLPLLIHCQENRGRAAVRNSGAALAKGDLLLFLDDDMRPEPEGIAEHIRIHHLHPGALVTGAQIDDERTATSDFLMYKAWLSQKWARPLRTISAKPLPINHIHLTAANFSVHRETFNALGGFDERLRDAEDFDLAIRAYKAGIPVYYHHEAFAWHDDRVTIRTYIRRLREYRRAHEVLRSVKPELYEDVEIRKLQYPKGLKGAAFALFAQPFWISLIDADRLKSLPEKLRYKIYGLVTTAYGSFFPEKDKELFDGRKKT